MSETILPSAKKRGKYAGKRRAPVATTGTHKALAGLTTAGAVMAGSVGLASSADAASSSTWDRLAQCESSGNWAINSGNGFSGGLQFTPGTWRAFGGGAYASSAHQASRGQQIAVAEKVLAGQGWGAWPSCSRKLGLSSSDSVGKPNVSVAGNKGRTVATSRSADRSDVVDKPEFKHRSKPAPARPAAQPRQASGHQYHVRAGDTLSEIAVALKVPGGWSALYSLNRGAIGNNPDIILIGQVLELPR
jgi:resuscitation-promoting factor RpfA